MSFKDISYLELWRPFCSAVVQEEMSFKRFLSGALAALLFSGAEPFVQFLKEGIMGNIHVKLYEIWSSGLGGDIF